VAARPFIQVAIDEVRPLMIQEEMKDLMEIVRGEKQFDRHE
jgi:hypothetical protein